MAQLDITPGILDLTLTRTNQWSFAVSIPDFDFTGYTITGLASDGTAITITPVDMSVGSFTCSMTTADMDMPGGRYSYYIRATLGVENWTLIYGSFTVVNYV